MAVSFARPGTLGAMLGAAALACAPPAPRGLSLVAGPDAADPARPGYHDFGHVADGERAVHAYLLRNDSAAAIGILDVVPGCGCTVPSLSYRASDGSLVEGKKVLPGKTPEAPLLVVPPGLTAELSLAIETERVRPHNSQHLYTTRITTDSDVTPYLTLETNIQVDHPFLVVPEQVELGSIPVSGGGEGRVTISQAPGFDWLLTGEASASGEFEVELVDFESVGRRAWQLLARVQPPVAQRRLTGVATLAVRTQGGEPARPVRVELGGTGVPDLATDPARLILIADASSDAAAEGSAELFSLIPGQRLVVKEVVVPPEHAGLLQASCTPLEPDGEGRSARWRVTLRSGPPPESLLKGSLHLVLAGETDEVELPYVIHRR